MALTASARMDLSTSMSDQPAALRRWHAVVTSKNPALLEDLLADDVVFRSPAVFAPQEGKALTASYLSAALKVLGPSLRYVSQWHDEASAVLEFEADLDRLLASAERSALVTVTRYTTQGSAETAGASTDLVMARHDGRLHVLTRDPADRTRLIPAPAGDEDIRDTLAGLLNA